MEFGGHWSSKICSRKNGEQFTIMPVRLIQDYPHWIHVCLTTTATTPWR